MKKLTIFTFLMLAFGLLNAQIVTWDFAGTNGASSATANNVAADMETGAAYNVAALGSGLTAKNYGAADGLEAGYQTATTLADAIAGDDYITFTVKPKSGYKISLSSIDLRPFSQNRARSFALLSSVDGFSSANEIGTISYQGNSGSDDLFNIPLSGHSDITSEVEFRVYIYGGTNQYESCGLAGSGNDLLVNGIVEPSATLYSLTVNSGSGDGNYPEGEVVPISADAAPSGKQFDAWTGSTSYVANIESASTTVTIPAANISVSATYEDIPTGVVNITNITDAAYATATLELGLVYYMDRAYTITGIPAGFDDLQIIKTENDDKNQTAVPLWSFDVDQATTVYVAYDSRATSLPNWMSSYTNTGKQLQVTDVAGTLNLYSLDVQAGTVEMGGNKASGSAGAGTNYVVIVGGSSSVCNVTLSKSSHGFESAAGSTTVDVTSSESFTVSDDQSWISTSTSGNTVTISVTENTSTSSRSGVVTINGCETKTVSISQSGSTGCTLTLSKSSHGFGSAAGSTTVDVTTSENFTVSDDQSWISTSTSGSTVTISVTENTNTTSRSGVVTISGCETKTVSISQNGKTIFGDWPAVGVGLDGVVNYASYSAFSDAMKHAKWKDVASWNSNGYPTSAQPGTDVTARMGVDNGDTWIDGQYILTWTGSGDVVLNRPGDATLVSEDLSSNPKKRVYNCNVEKYGLEIQINSFPVDNIHLYIPGCDENTTSLWNPEYVEYMKPFAGGPLRFMDMNGTNGSTQKDWSDRMPRDWSSYAQAFNNCASWSVKGKVSYEAMIELCNEVGADMYIPIPHLATDDYVAKLAQLIKANLDSDRKVWIEYSNEVWNWNFAQSSWVNDNLPGTNIDDKYAVQAAKLFDIFRSNFNDNDRVIRVIGTQTGWSEGWRTKNRLEAIDRSKYDALAITSYFNPKLISNSKNMQQWVYDNWGASELDMINEMKSRLGSGKFRIDEDLEDGVDRYWHFYHAEQYNVPVITYEGGDHINAVNKVDTNGDGSGDTRLNTAIPESVDYIARVVRHSEFDEVTKQWWQRHKESGLKTNIPFVLVGGWSEYGQWGMVEYVGQPVDEAQEYKATLDFYNLPYPNLKSAKSALESPGTANNIMNKNTMLYPNPVSGGAFYLELNQDAEVSITSITGKEVYRNHLAEGKSTISARGFNAGLYILTIKTSDNLEIIKILVK